MLADLLLYFFICCWYATYLAVDCGWHFVRALMFPINDNPSSQTCVQFDVTGIVISLNFKTPSSLLSTNTVKETKESEPSSKGGSKKQKNRITSTGKKKIFWYLGESEINEKTCWPKILKNMRMSGRYLLSNHSRDKPFLKNVSRFQVHNYIIQHCVHYKVITKSLVPSITIQLTPFTHFAYSLLF